ncbi:hypothetical protein, partial [Propionibacterium freudenreichii]
LSSSGDLDLYPATDAPARRATCATPSSGKSLIPLREAIASAVGTIPTELWGYDIVLDEIMKEI